MHELRPLQEVLLFHSLACRYHKPSVCSLPSSHPTPSGEPFPPPKKPPPPPSRLPAFPPPPSSQASKNMGDVWVSIWVSEQHPQGAASSPWTGASPWTSSTSRAAGLAALTLIYPLPWATGSIRGGISGGAAHYWPIGGADVGPDALAGQAATVEKGQAPRLLSAAEGPAEGREVSAEEKGDIVGQGIQWQRPLEDSAVRQDAEDGEGAVLNARPPAISVSPSLRDGTVDAAQPLLLPGGRAAGHPPPPADLRPHPPSMRPAVFLRGLLLLSAINSVCTLARAFSFAFAGMAAAKRTHEKLLGE